jgi:uncharacterized protein (TIGR03437 family)
MLPLRVTLLALLAAAAMGQNRIPPRAVVHAASFAQPGLPGGAIPRGGIFTIFGQGIGGATAQAEAFPLGEELAGVSVTISQGDVAVQAFPVFASPNQVNAILPSDAPLGRASLRVRNGARTSNPVPVEITAANVGLFTAGGTGRGPAAAQNRLPDGTLPFNSPLTPAAPGDALNLWATGLGAVNFPDNVAPMPGDLPGLDLEIWLGDREVPRENVLYAGRSPCCAGLDQIVLQIPDDAVAGCYVPLQLRAGGGPLSNTVTLAIAPETGEPCSHALPGMVPGGNRGLITLLSTAVDDRVDRGRALDYTFDRAFARFRTQPLGVFSFNPVVELPPAGACAAYQWQGSIQSVMAAGAGEALDAGADVRLNSPRGVARLTPVPAGLAWSAGYHGFLGGESDGFGFVDLLARGPYLLPGANTISISGGAQVGPAEVEVTTPDRIEWTNQEAVGIIGRAEPLALEWAPSGDAEKVIIVAGSRDLPLDATAAVVCTADPAAGRITVGERLLGTLPPSRPEPGQSVGWVYVGALNASGWSAEGLDAGVAAALAGHAKTVIFE